ncbi:MAG: antitoxin family protein [Planctomycetes bacterium]|nr:antitoxin family protein [Planctomycetota bacterium]
MYQTIIATFEDGVLRPSEPLDLPAHAQVRVTVELLADGKQAASPGMDKIYEILSRRYASGHTDTAERHNEHQP